MINRKRLCNDFIEVVGSQLHYFDKSEEIDLNTCKAADIISLSEG